MVLAPTHSVGGRLSFHHLLLPISGGRDLATGNTPALHTMGGQNNPGRAPRLALRIRVRQGAAYLLAGQETDWGAATAAHPERQGPLEETQLHCSEHPPTPGSAGAAPSVGLDQLCPLQETLGGVTFFPSR